ncbi:MAG: GNAT family N-acetyltransferase [Pseudomonadota bacterium]|nr:GNAT family N-acetyltransferase [Pseudomonadota bacterium]
MIELETDRLIINEFNVADKLDWAKIDCNENVRKYLPGNWSKTDSEIYLDNVIGSYQKNGFGRYAVRCKLNYQLIGMCGFLLEEYGIDFGYRFTPSYWGTGIGYEAAKKVLTYGRVYLKLSPIYALTHERNYASLKIIEKLNFRFVERLNIYQQEVLKYVIY